MRKATISNTLRNAWGRVSVGAAVLLAISIIGFLITLRLGMGLWDGDGAQTTEPPALAGTKRADQAPSATAEYEQHFTAMQAEYEHLRRARRALGRKLARAKALTGGVYLPADQANAIMRHTHSGYALLQTPKLLGAFSSPQEIKDELARVVYAGGMLDEVIEQLQAARSHDGK